MADRQFDAAQARAWRTEVNGELYEVDKLLHEVVEATTTNPHEDDTMIMILYDVGKGLNEAWNGLIKGFRGLVENMDNIFNEISKGIADSVEKIGEFARNFHI